MIKGGEGWDDYVDRIGLFFFFVACAGVSLIVWAFNWVCWLNQCCCCDFLHNPVNKRIAWWLSFTFLCGMLACCISGCVSVNRFGFAIEGARCALDRIYYDSLNGQLKNEPKWEGFKNAYDLLENFTKFITEIRPDNDEFKDEECTLGGATPANPITSDNQEKAFEYIRRYKEIAKDLINFFVN